MYFSYEYFFLPAAKSRQKIQNAAKREFNKFSKFILTRMDNIHQVLEINKSRRFCLCWSLQAFFQLVKLSRKLRFLPRIHNSSLQLSNNFPRGLLAKSVKFLMHLRPSCHSSQNWWDVQKRRQLPFLRSSSFSSSCIFSWRYLDFVILEAHP